jgi:hypothetical protein
MTMALMAMTLLLGQAAPTGAGAAPGWRAQAQEVVRADLGVLWSCGEELRAAERRALAATAAMAGMVPEARREIDAALSSQDPQAREAALAALSSVDPTGEETTAVVAAIVAPPSWMSRALALGIAGNDRVTLGDRERGAILRVLAAETDPALRRASLGFLRRVPDEVAVPILVRWIANGSPEGTLPIYLRLRTTMKARLEPVKEALERQGSWEALRTIRELERRGGQE